MEESWENFNIHMELDCGDDYFIDKCDAIDIDSDDFLREILLETPQNLINSESENDSVTVDVVVNNMVKSNSSNSIVSQQHHLAQQSKTLILSFDNSTMIPATPETCVNLDYKRDNCCSKSDMMKRNEEKGVKRGRSSSQCNDHIMAERKRRQELSERFIALSTTIPGLSKTDKSSILRATIDYVKHLQERVHDLEKQDKNVDVTSTMVLKKSNQCGIINKNEDNNSGETNGDDDCNNNILTKIEAKVLGNDVLIEIHCEKQIGIELKVLKHIENLQLFVTGSNVVPFGKSDISITVIAQMDKGYKVMVDGLVKSLRRVILKREMGCESDLF